MYQRNTNINILSNDANNYFFFVFSGSQSSPRLPNNDSV